MNETMNSQRAKEREVTIIQLPLPCEKKDEGYKKAFGLFSRLFRRYKLMR